MLSTLALRILPLLYHSLRFAVCTEYALMIEPFSVEAGLLLLTGLRGLAEKIGEPLARLLNG